ncbi:MAG: BCCT family transporter [Candidatus Tectomicrobia bacterium]|nr:BCCT family transporter [Candidatus Tectomicrobia bacterium]
MREPDSEHRVGQDNIQFWGLDVHHPVFFVSAGLIVLFVALTLVFQQNAANVFNAIKTFMTGTFGWFFMLAVNVFVLFVLVVAFSPLGKIRLGGRDATPDFSYGAWFAMLFSAGMGIGIMFWSVAEPVFHYKSPPLGASGATPEAAQVAMAATLFHWGLHAWAVYAVVGLALAFFAFNRGLPLTIRSAFEPLFGQAAWGWLGHIIDTLAVFATLFGLATSLGLGVQQANAGLHFLFGTPDTIAVQVVLIMLITGIATMSVVAGLESGVKRLSQLNMVLAALLLLFVLSLGPTGFILKGLGQYTSAYLQNLPQLSSWFGRDSGWLSSWTVFYWAWWIAWSPFVGMFIARISRGRTVRQFVIGVLLVPTLITFVWMAAFGGSALHQILNGVGDLSGAVNANVATAMFVMLQQLPLSQLASFVGIILVIVFFVTSSDSGSLVIDSITAGGKLEAPVPQRVFWAITEGIVAAVLLLGGGLAALQTASITTGLPFAIVLCLMCVGLLKGLRQERREYAQQPTADLPTEAAD